MPAFGAWAAALVAYGLAMMYAWRLTKSTPPSMSDLGSTWIQQDANFYLGIAAKGYAFHPDATAFYPLYPLLVRAANVIIPGGVLVAAMAVAALSSFGALLLIHRFVSVEFDERTADRTTFFLAAFPTAFFLYAPYNESLFILLLVGALYAARRGNWWLASTVAALATTTRLFGVLLLAPLCFEYLRQQGWSWRRIRWDAMSFALVPSGLVAYAAFCYVEFGNALAFVDAQAAWQRRYGWPGESLIDAFGLVNRGPFLHEWHLITLFELGSMLLGIVLIVLGFVGPWKIRRDQYFLLIASILPVLLLSATMVGIDRNLNSTPRYALEWLVIFVVLARMGANLVVERIYLATAFMLQGIMISTYLLDANWVA